MEVRIENVKLGKTIDLLFGLKLRGKQSRHRTKFIKLLNDRLTEVAEEDKDLLKEHCYLDENGEPKKTKDGQRWDVKDLSALAKDRNELYNEEFVIDGGNNETILKSIRSVLSDLDVELSGEEASIYDYLCEQFKVNEEIEEDN